ncbi:MAG: hypothetical protein ABJM29_17105 [Rhizobiaceae bacterium]
MKKTKADKDHIKPSRLALLRRRRTRLFDLGLGMVGLALAGVSSYLPYYVYFNETEFGPPTMQFTGRIDYEAPVVVERSRETRRPLFTEELAVNFEAQEIDPLVTGSIQPDGDGIPRLRPRVRPRPSLEQFNDLQAELTVHESLELVFATRGRALIRDGDDILPIAVGSRLPDGSTVKSLLRKQNGWQVVTSNNHVLKPSN